MEASEVKSPLIVDEFSLVQDSGGAGRQRGGLGLRRVTRMTTPASFNCRIERTKCAPWGLDGGKDALANHIYVQRRDGTVFQPPNGKIDVIQLEAGDAYVLESGGGGGFGNPLERPLQAVVADVRAGYISAETAERDYAVAVSGKPAMLDEQRTRELREALLPFRAERGIRRPATDASLCSA